MSSAISRYRCDINLLRARESLNSTRFSRRVSSRQHRRRVDKDARPQGGFMKLTRRDFTAGIMAGIAAPHIISSAKAQGATIKIGMCTPVTGPAAESGGYAIKGAKLALEAVNKDGGILGKQGDLIVEDDQTTNPGIVLAFSKLAAQSDIVAFLGSIRSTQVHAMAPD